MAFVLKTSEIFSSPARRGSPAARAQKQTSVAALLTITKSKWESPGQMHFVYKNKTNNWKTSLSTNSAIERAMNLQYQVFHKCNSLLKKEIFFLLSIFLLCLSICSHLLLPVCQFSVTFKRAETTGLINLQGDAARRLRV